MVFYLNRIIKKKIKEGQGVFVWADGSIYEGNFRDNEPNYHGRIIYATGNVYEG